MNWWGRKRAGDNFLPISALISHPCPVYFILEIPAGASTGKRGLKGRPIRKLMGGGAKYKKYSRKGKLNEKKIHARQLTLKNIHAIA